jgi:poly(3-hydroxybutyrate) depolymerase
MHGHRVTLPLAATPATMAASWPPLLVIQGTADAVVAPSNGRAAALTWANAAGAQAGAPRRIQRGKRYPMVLTDFMRRDGSTVATLAEVDGLGHAWSGGAPGQAFCDSRGPDASRMAWAFAVRQFQAEPAGVAPRPRPVPLPTPG